MLFVELLQKLVKKIEAVNQELKRNIKQQNELKTEIVDSDCQEGKNVSSAGCLTRGHRTR